MTVATSVGPLSPAVRDAVREYRDEHGFDNYNETLAALVDAEGDHTT